MKYSVATILCNGLDDWQIDLLTQQLADLGFDSFEQDGTTLRAYIPSNQLSAIHFQLSNFSQLSTIEPCPDENWNAVWESSHEVEQLPLGVRITPHCAFGAGHHETTSMMISELMSADLRGKRVFDHGTGTGVLAIFAAKLGAAYVLADDIDDNSVRNARENAADNGVTIDVQPATFHFPPSTSFHTFRSFSEGDKNFKLSTFNLILANIHRNILLDQMPAYAHALAADGELWLSGFYEADIPALLAAARANGLQHIATRTNGEWRMLVLRK